MQDKLYYTYKAKLHLKVKRLHDFPSCLQSGGKRVMHSQIICFSSVSVDLNLGLVRAVSTGLLIEVFAWSLSQTQKTKRMKEL